jgi:hypothetical protein
VRGAVSTAQWQTHTWLAGSRHWGTRMMMGWVCGEARSRTTASHLRCLRGPQVPRPSSQACLALSPPTAARQSTAACLSTLRSLALLLVAACPHSPKPPLGCTHARLSCALWGKPCPAPVATRNSWRQQRTWCSLQGTTTLQGTASRFSLHQHDQESLSFMYCTGTPYRRLGENLCSNPTSPSARGTDTVQGRT